MDSRASKLPTASASCAGAIRSQMQLLEPYFLGLDRAMVSLGPLTDNVYCTYKCRFCYVNGPYRKYARRTNEEIFTWLRDKRKNYGIIYISGDTDSFAPPRTAEALDLLDRLLALQVDVLFTTRYVFSPQERKILQSIIGRYACDGRLLVPCISISQLSHPELEPSPIPSPAERFDQLQWFHEIGANAILTVRPFIPYIDGEEYAEIVRLGARYAAAILGGDLYTDEEGVIDGITRSVMKIPVTSIGGGNVSKSQLDSTNDPTEWLITHHPQAEILAGAAAHAASKPFFMRSGPAVEFLRSHSE